MAGSVDLLGIFLPILMMLIFAYAAYWAFAIRKSLAVRVYRNQALGVGLIALGPIAFSLELLALGSPAVPTPPLIFAVYLATGFGLTLLTFYWIDASVLAARRGDPLLRNTFHWTRLRFLLWTLIIAGEVAVVIVFVLGGSLNFFYPFSGQAVSNLWLLPTLVTAISGVVVVPTIAFRSRDAVFRTHLRWFALFEGTVLILIAASALGIVLITSISASGSSLIEFASLLAGGYFLYRSARSLVPLNRL